MFKWHEVTPFSRILAIVLFVGLIPSIFFYLGMQYQDTKDTKNLMRTYDFPRLQNFADTDAAVPAAVASTTVEISL